MAKRKAPGRSKRTNEEVEYDVAGCGNESGLDGAATPFKSTRARRKHAVEAAKASRATSESRDFYEERNRWDDIEARLRRGIEDIEEVRPALAKLGAYCEDVLREKYPNLPEGAKEWARGTRRRLKDWQDVFLSPATANGPAPTHIQVKLLLGQPVQWQGGPPKSPRTRRDLQIEYLTEKLSVRGVALPMPLSRGGKRGIKAEITQQALEERPDLFASRDAVNNAWKDLPKQPE
jgi:hypothetical protein